MDYSGTVGAITGQLLPTGNPVERMELENGVSFDVTLCDVANPCAILPAEASASRATRPRTS